MSWRSPNNDKALEYATIFARDTPVEVMPGMSSVRFLSKADSKRAFKELMKGIAKSDTGRLAEYADYASQGWGLADGDMRELIMELVRAGQQLPPLLSAYSTLLAVDPPRKVSGPERADNVFRDIAITLIVNEVAEVFNLTPTARGENRSACRVVAEALTGAKIPMGHKQVEQIWNRVDRMLRPS